MKKKLAQLVGDDLEAANLMLGVTVAHALMYDTSAVTPELFLAAMLKGADGFLQGKVADSVLANFKQAMVDEGVKRELVPPGWVPPPGTSSPQLVAALTGGVVPGGAPVLGSGGMSGLELARRLTAFAQRSEVTYRVVSEPRVGAMRKAILQANVTAPDGQTYPVEDGFVTVALNHETIEAVGGRGRTLPAFDFTEPSFTADQAREKARDLALKGLADGDARTNGYVQANIDELFAPQNVRYQEVLSGGQRARKVITQAAEFTVRRDGSIEVSKVMHVD